MKFFTQNKIAEYRKWHFWFAWHPVFVERTPDGDAKWVWLEYVWRCGSYRLISLSQSRWEWEYKEIQNKDQ